jgi:hypothetical protein
VGVVFPILGWGVLKLNTAFCRNVLIFEAITAVVGCLKLFFIALPSQTYNAYQEICVQWLKIINCVCFAFRSHNSFCGQTRKCPPFGNNTHGVGT